MKKLLMVAVLATLAFTAIACGPPATTGGTKATVVSSSTTTTPTK